MFHADKQNPQNIIRAGFNGWPTGIIGTAIYEGKKKKVSGINMI